MRERKTRIGIVQVSPTLRKEPVQLIRSDYFCCDCGQQNVWQRVDADEDDAHGCVVECHTCGGSMCCMEKVIDEEPT